MSPNPPIEEIAAALIETYGSPEPEKGDKEPLDGLVLTILSQNTSDRNRDAAFGRLKAAYPSWRDVLNAGTESLEETIRVGGLANVKAKKIVKLLEQLASEGNGLTLKGLRELTNEEVERYLLSIDGVGKKTAKCVLLFDLDRTAFPVDTHIFRIAKRLGWIPEKCSADRAHDLLGDIIPPELMYGLHINLIRHGRALCRPRNPGCDKCPLSDRCAYGRDFLASKAGNSKKENRARAD